MEKQVMSDKKIQVVLIAGKKGSGKTTVANALKKELLKSNIKSEVLSFATPIKEFLIDGNILTESSAYGDDKQKEERTKVKAHSLPKEIRKKYKWGLDYTLSTRDVLQIFGNDICKMFNEFIWVDKMNKRINKVIKENNEIEIIIIDDFRFSSIETCLPFNLLKVYLNLNIVEDDKEDSFFKRLKRIFIPKKYNNKKHKSENSIDIGFVDMVLEVNHKIPCNDIATAKAIKYEIERRKLTKEDNIWRSLVLQ